MATRRAPLTVPEQLQLLAREVHDLAFDFLEPARDHRDSEARIARVEDLASRLRATVRGQA